MRYSVSAVLILVVLASGCGTSPAEDVVDANAKKPTPSKDEMPSLWTRKQGIDWPSFLGPNRDSKSPEKGIITDWKDGGLRIVWQRKLGTGYGIGSVAKGRYYQFDRFVRKARLYCLNAETGKELWEFEYDTDYRDMLGYNNGPRCSPIIEGNRVYIFGVEGMLHCVRATDGKLIWKKNTEKEFGVVQNFFGVGGTPQIEGDLLVCMIGGSPPGSPGLYASRGAVDGNGSGVVAFNKFTGEVKYKFSDELASYSSMKIAKVNGRQTGFAFCRGGLIGFDPATGKSSFHYPWRSRKLESVNAMTPVVVGNEVFISETYEIGSSLLKVKMGGYDLVWKDNDRVREKAMETHWNTPIHIGGYLYGCSGRDEPDADLRCVQWKTGKVQWVEQLPLEIRERQTLMYVDGHFIVLGELGTLKLIKANPEKYELVSEVTFRTDEPGTDPIDGGKPKLLKMPCWAAPILSHGLLYVRGNDRLVCLELIPDKE